MGPYVWDNAKSLDENLEALEAHQLVRIKAVRGTPRKGPVLLSDGTRVGHARRLNGTAWDRIDADWRAVSGFSDPVEPVKGEAVAA